MALLSRSSPFTLCAIVDAKESLEDGGVMPVAGEDDLEAACGIGILSAPCMDPLLLPLNFLLGDDFFAVLPTPFDDVDSPPFECLSSLSFTEGFPTLFCGI